MLTEGTVSEVYAKVLLNISSKVPDDRLPTRDCIIVDEKDSTSSIK
jgi:hypothetical protein